MTLIFNYKQISGKIMSFLVTLLLLFNICVVNAQDGGAISFGEEEVEPEYLFGFNLMESASGYLFNLGLVKTKPNGRKKVRFITVEDFVGQASGKVYSLANPKNINFFEKYNIKEPAKTLRLLWKLRYKKRPFVPKGEKGWANYADTAFFVLSQPQQETLRKYGMNTLRDFIVGENAFKLLRNMEDTTVWVKQYMSGSAAGPN